jgi:hypothetical protein
VALEKREQEHALAAEVEVRKHQASTIEAVLAEQRRLAETLDEER